MCLQLDRCYSSLSATSAAAAAPAAACDPPVDDEAVEGLESIRPLGSTVRKRRGASTGLSVVTDAPPPRLKSVEAPKGTHPVAAAVYDALLSLESHPRRVLYERLRDLKDAQECKAVVISFAHAYPRVCGGSMAVAMRTCLRATDLARCEAVLNCCGATLGAHPIAEGIHNTLSRAHLGGREEKTTAYILRLLAAIENHDDCQKVVDTFAVAYPDFYGGEIVEAMRCTLSPVQLSAAQAILHDIGVTLGEDIKPVRLGAKTNADAHAPNDSNLSTSQRLEASVVSSQAISRECSGKSVGAGAASPTGSDASAPRTRTGKAAMLVRRLGQKLRGLVQRREGEGGAGASPRPTGSPSTAEGDASPVSAATAEEAPVVGREESRSQMMRLRREKMSRAFAERALQNESERGLAA